MRPALLALFAGVVALAVGLGPLHARNGEPCGLRCPPDKRLSADCTCVDKVVPCGLVCRPGQRLMPNCTCEPKIVPDKTKR